ncbi:hypothetical protein M422DRAFT_242223 [Sphaerobolus stellatus SS14]|nr:hypothetical protein M422DRAFT_242223 [Sphaerobolus stellatus SS14]
MTSHVFHSNRLEPGQEGTNQPEGMHEDRTVYPANEQMDSGNATDIPAHAFSTLPDLVGFAMAPAPSATSLSPSRLTENLEKSNTVDDGRKSHSDSSDTGKPSLVDHLVGAMKDTNAYLKKLIEATSESQTSLDHILKTMHQSDFFSRYEEGDEAQFWNQYKQVAKQTDEEFLERYNGDLDAQLIFAGLFSAVSSAFISKWKALYNRTQTQRQMLCLHTLTGLGSTVLWTQALAYLSLGLSLLAAFGAVLGKQWLAQFKTSRFGYGTRSERGIRRYRKVKGIEEWHLRPILDSLPVILQLSLLLFGISLAVDLFSLNKGLSGVITALLVFGIIFHAGTFILALKYEDSLFKIGLTIIAWSLMDYLLQRLSPSGYSQQANRVIKSHGPSREENGVSSQEISIIPTLIPNSGLSEKPISPLLQLTHNRRIPSQEILIQPYDFCRHQQKLKLLTGSWHS